MARFWRQTLRRIPSWDACLALAVPAGCAGMLAEAYTRTAIGDAEPAAACAFAPLALSAANAETLTRRGLVVVDDVLSAGELAAARRDAATLARFAPRATTANAATPYAGCGATTTTSAPASDRPCASSAASPTLSLGAATK